MFVILFLKNVAKVSINFVCRSLLQRNLINLYFVNAFFAFCCDMRRPRWSSGLKANYQQINQQILNQ